MVERKETVVNLKNFCCDVYAFPCFLIFLFFSSLFHLHLVMKHSQLCMCAAILSCKVLFLAAI